MGGRACSCCSHPQTAAITKAIAAGDSFRAISSRFHVTVAAAQRHATNCLKVTRSEAKPKAPIAEKEPRAPFTTDDPQALVAATARLVDEALDLLEHAKKSDDRRTALAALREARDGLALLMRIAGMLQGDSPVIDARTQTVQILGNLSNDDLRALVAAGRAAQGTPADSLRFGSDGNRAELEADAC